MNRFEKCTYSKVLNSILNQIFVFLSKYFKLFVIIEVCKLAAGFAAIRLLTIPNLKIQTSNPPIIQLSFNLFLNEQEM